MTDERETKLTHFGLKDQGLRDTLKNEAQVTVLLEVYEEAGLNANHGLEPKVLALLREAALKLKGVGQNRRIVIEYILGGGLRGPHMEETIKYFAKVKNQPFDRKEFEHVCQIGKFYNAEQIREVVKQYLAENAAVVKEKRYGGENEFINEIKKIIVVDRKELRDIFLVELEKVIGPKNSELDVKKKPKEKKNREVTNITNADNRVQIQESISFPDPKDNAQIKKELLEKHLAKTGGIVITRFPPEPNGHLHIGHAKSMSLNFGYSRKLGGKCYMRFDDTNPEVENIEYINSILETVKWMGYEWCEITHASDYFDELYDLAIELIKRGKAFVCHMTSEQIKEYRSQQRESPWRDRPIEENLIEFDKMKQGCYKEGEAVLRMKMDMKSNNPCMWDHVAYRIKYVPHPNPKVGDKWCIYPSYDYTHCINDSLENITHSLCTLEFEMRRESYNWLLDQLDLYKPVVWEYGRLSLTYTLLSKRKLIQLVEGDFGLKGWDDPRLPTINGLRRRGFTSEAIKNFCEDIGVTRKPDVVIPFSKLEEFVRDHLNVFAVRCFAVFDPIKVHITNWTSGKRDVVCPNIPERDAGNHTVPFTSVIYIERSDFKEKDVKDYFGLALDKPKWIRLKYADVIIRLTDIIRDFNGNAVELKCIYDDKGEAGKVAGNIHWVSEPETGKEPIKVEIRNYDRLFLSENPLEKGKDAWVQDINPNSLVILHAYADNSVANLKPQDKVQFERIGYYCVDYDSTPTHLVFNRTVALKESKWKRTNKDE